MEIIDAVVGFVTNQWVGSVLFVLFTVLAIVIKKDISAYRTAINEFLDVAKAHKEARDPKGEAGIAYSDKERAKLEKELGEAILSLAGLVNRKKDNKIV